MENTIEIQEPVKIEEITKEWLEKKYIEEDLGVWEIAQIFKTIQTKPFSELLEKFGIPKKSKGRRKQELIQKDCRGEKFQNSSNSFIVDGEEFQIEDRFYLKTEVNQIKQDQLVTVLACKGKEVLVRDKYMFSKFWTELSNLYPI